HPIMHLFILSSLVGSRHPLDYEQSGRQSRKEKKALYTVLTPLCFTRNMRWSRKPEPNDATWSNFNPTRQKRGQKRGQKQKHKQKHKRRISHSPTQPSPLLFTS
ncbi:hypothetical protein C7212DRAFT_313000, partial [Tuber magnatum]